MTKNENGMLVVEASIALTAFMFFILFFLSFSSVYRAQDVVSHASFQTAQTMAVESFSREKIGESGTLGAITKLADFIGEISGEGRPSIIDSYSSYGTVSNLNSIISKEFAYSIADSVESADEKLERLGVVDGLDGLDFTGSSVENSLITIKVRYKLNLQFNFFNVDAIELSKTAVCKAFASIEENNSIAPSENDLSGNSTTSNVN